MHFKLHSFEIRKYPEKNQLLVLVSGNRRYYQILRDAFPQYFFSPAFNDQYRVYNWGTYIHGISPNDEIKLLQLLELLKQVVCIDDILKQTFALDYHMRPEYDGGRTKIGDLVYHAKYQNSIPKAEELITHFETFIVSHPLYSKSNFLLATPSSDPNKFSLPGFLVNALCTKLEIPDGGGYVKKVKETRPMKDIKTIQEKTENIRGAFKISDAAPLEGKIVTIVDDLYQSGVTMNELATELQKHGAIVLGLAGTKTISDPR